MDKNYEIGDLVWETKIPAKLKIHHLNLGSDIEPPLFYIMIKRIHYISVYYKQIHDHFKNFVSSAFSINDLWLEWKDKPILWDIPFGVIFDLYQKEDGDLPIEIQVHYRFFPSNYLREVPRCLKVKEEKAFEEQEKIPENDIYYSFFMWDLKQSSCIKFEKNADNIIMKLTEQDSNKLWESYQNGDKKIFMPIFENIWDFKKNENKRMEYKCLPMRIFLNDQKIKIQRGIKIEKNQENKTIGEFFQELFPEIFKKNCKNQENKNNFKFLCHGIDVDLKLPLLFLYEKFYYFDGFVYISVKFNL